MVKHFGLVLALGALMLAGPALASHPPPDVAIATAQLDSSIDTTNAGEFAAAASERLYVLGAIVPDRIGLTFTDGESAQVFYAADNFIADESPLAAAIRQNDFG